MKASVPPQVVREIAVLAEVDPKTVVRALRDWTSIRPSLLYRIQRALAHLQLQHLLTAQVTFSEEP